MSPVEIGFFQEFGERLLQNGYTPIPIKPREKCPGQYQGGRWSGFPQWSHFLNSPPDFEIVKTWSSWPGSGIGLLTGKIVGIDVDVTIGELASKIVDMADEFLGTSPLMRIGKEPKSLLVYQATDEIKKMSVGSKGLMVEVLGIGQQFVAYGIHPETDQPYWWPMQMPVDVPVNELPRIGRSEIERYLKTIEPLIKTVTGERKSNLEKKVDLSSLSTPVPTRSSSITELQDALRFVPNRDLDWDAWNRMGMAIFAATSGGGFDLFDEWSSRSSKYDTEDTARKWEDLKRSPPDRISAGTIFFEARQNGWRTHAPLQSRQTTADPVVASIEKFAESKSPFGGLRFKSTKEVLSAPSNPDWLVKKVLERGGLSMLIGEPGVGKSFLVIDLAVSIALGQPWLDFLTKQGAVFVIAGEGHAGFNQRLKAIEKHRACSLSEIPLFFSSAAISLTEEESVVYARLEIDRLSAEHGPPSLIIVDTLHRNFGGGDENSAKDISKMLQIVDSCLRGAEEPCAVMLVHHSGHGDKGRARGSSSLFGAMDTEMLLARDGEAGAVLSVTKQKNHQPIKDFAVKFLSVKLDEIDDEGEVVTSRVVVLGDASATRKDGKRLSPALSVALRELENVMWGGEEPPEDLQKERGMLCPSKVVDKHEWRRACFKGGISPRSNPDAKRKAFDRAFNQLNSRGLIHVWKHCVWLPQTPALDRKKSSDNGTGQDKGGQVEKGTPDGQDTPLYKGGQDGAEVRVEGVTQEMGG
jgi:hypothetical protein